MKRYREIGAGRSELEGGGSVVVALPLYGSQGLGTCSRPAIDDAAGGDALGRSGARAVGAGFGGSRLCDQSRRGGARPLVVEAVGVAGLARTDIVISETDAQRIRQANAAGRFLERFQVDIVIER